MLFYSLALLFGVSRAAMSNEPEVAAAAGPIAPGTLVHRLDRPQDDPLRSDLHKTARRGNIVAFRRVAQPLGDSIPVQYIDAADGSGRTILMEICRSGALDILQYVLLNSGDHVFDFVDNDGNTALSEAIKYGHYRVMGVLILAATSKNDELSISRLLGGHSTSYSHFLQIFVWSCAVGIDEVATGCY